LSDQLQTKKMRAEELDASMLGSYGCVVVRAVAKTNILIEYAQPFLTAGGYALIAKGTLTLLRSRMLLGGNHLWHVFCFT